jgi:oligoribonuclease (3'-5' exoribonuclease)
MSDKLNRLVWIDCEMTGLDPQIDQLVEIATMVTDAEEVEFFYDNRICAVV